MPTESTPAKSRSSISVEPARQARFVDSTAAVLQQLEEIVGIFVLAATFKGQRFANGERYRLAPPDFTSGLLLAKSFPIEFDEPSVPEGKLKRRPIPQPFLKPWCFGSAPIRMSSCE